MFLFVVILFLVLGFADLGGNSGVIWVYTVLAVGVCFSLQCGVAVRSTWGCLFLLGGGRFSFLWR